MTPRSEQHPVTSFQFLYTWPSEGGSTLSQGSTPSPLLVPTPDFKTWLSLIHVFQWFHREVQLIRSHTGSIMEIIAA